jgi:hypothetical protein
MRIQGKRKLIIPNNSVFFDSHVFFLKGMYYYSYVQSAFNFEWEQVYLYFMTTTEERGEEGVCGLVSTRSPTTESIFPSYLIPRRSTYHFWSPTKYKGMDGRT